MTRTSAGGGGLDGVVPRYPIKRVKARRRAAGNLRPFNPKLLAQKYDQIARLKDRFGVRAISVSNHDAAAIVMRLLTAPVNGEWVRPPVP